MVLSSIVTVTSQQSFFYLMKLVEFQHCYTLLIWKTTNTTKQFSAGNQLNQVDYILSSITPDELETGAFPVIVFPGHS